MNETVHHKECQRNQMNVTKCKRHICNIQHETADDFQEGYSITSSKAVECFHLYYKRIFTKVSKISKEKSKFGKMLEFRGFWVILRDKIKTKKIAAFFFKQRRLKKKRESELILPMFSTIFSIDLYCLIKYSAFF